MDRGDPLGIISGIISTLLSFPDVSISRQVTQATDALGTQPGKLAS